MTPPRNLMNTFCLTMPTHTIHVCKQFFLDTFSVSDCKVSRALLKYREGKSPGTDTRGKKPNPRAIPVEDTNFVKQHIESFPQYVSYYTRGHNPSKKYLSEYLDLGKCMIYM